MPVIDLTQSVAMHEHDAGCHADEQKREARDAEGAELAGDLELDRMRLPDVLRYAAFGVPFRDEDVPFASAE